MGTAREETTIARPADDVWAVVRDFGGLAGWAPGVESCRVEGDDRILTLMGMEIVERLYRRDDDERVLVYGIVSGPVPVEHHEATITVIPEGGSSRVTYDVDTDDAMVDVMRDAYAKTLVALKQKLER